MLANYQIEQSGDIALAYKNFVMQGVTPSQHLFGFILAEVELFCIGLGKQAQVSVGSGSVLDVKPIFLDLGPFCTLDRSAFSQWVQAPLQVCKRPRP